MRGEVRAEGVTFTPLTRGGPGGLPFKGDGFPCTRPCGFVLICVVFVEAVRERPSPEKAGGSRTAPTKPANPAGCRYARGVRTTPRGCPLQKGSSDRHGGLSLQTRKVFVRHSGVGANQCGVVEKAFTKGAPPPTPLVRGVRKSKPSTTAARGDAFFYPPDKGG